MTIVLTREPQTALDGAGVVPPAKTAVDYDMYDAGDYKPGDRVALRPEFYDNPDNNPHRAGTVVRVDDDVYPIIVWLDEFGRPTAVEAAGQTGLPVCAGDIYRVDDQ